MSDEQHPTHVEAATTKEYSFFGLYHHSMDQKGRIIIPNAYREELGETFTIGTTRDFLGVALYPTDVFNRIVKNLESFRDNIPVVQQVKDRFFKFSFPGSQSDAQGRILLPNALRQRMLGDAKEVDISGDHDSIRIMNAETALAGDEYFFKHREEILAEFGSLTY